MKGERKWGSKTSNVMLCRLATALLMLASSEKKITFTDRG